MRAVVAVRVARCGVAAAVTGATSVLEKVQTKGDWRREIRRTVRICWWVICLEEQATTWSRSSREVCQLQSYPQLGGDRRRGEHKTGEETDERLRLRPVKNSSNEGVSVG